MQTKRLGKTDTFIPTIGMGTWNVMPPDPYALTHPDKKEIIKTLRAGIDMGMPYIDTSAMYGGGKAEEVAGEVIKGIRDKVFLATKIEPEDYPYERVSLAARQSLKRLKTDYIDLYQIHWPSDIVPVEDTLGGMERLVDEGLVRYIGISNFDREETIRARQVMSKYPIVSNQVKYNVLTREIESDLLPYAEKENITIIAYSPFEVGQLFAYAGAGRDMLERLAKKYRKTFAQICLNWLVNHKSVVAIPRSVNIAHLKENATADGWRMAEEDYKVIDGLLSRV